MKTYELTLKHDAGQVTLRVRAESLQQAQNLVCDIERAPKSAIQSWRVIPTKKQTQKTKNLMRSI